MEITEFFNNLPKFTKYVIIGAAFLGIMTSLKMWNPSNAYLNLPDDVWRVWKYFTSSVYMGKFGFDFLFAAYFFCILNGRLESEYQGVRYNDYIYLIFLTWAGSLLLSTIWFWNAWFILSQPFFASLTYIYCKRNPQEKIFLFFVFSTKAAYYPFIMAGFSFLQGGSIATNIIGIIVGHCYIYFKDTLPVSKGKDYLKTPQFFHNAINWCSAKIARGQNIVHQQADNGAFRAFRGRGVRLG